MNVLDAENDVTPPPSLNFRQKMVVLTIDLFMIVELFISMYTASRTPDSFTASFIRTFVCFLIPTLVLGIFLIRRLKSQPPAFLS